MSRFRDEYNARKKAGAERRQLEDSIKTIRENIDLMTTIFNVVNKDNFMADTKFKIYKRDALEALDYIEDHV